LGLEGTNRRLRPPTRWTVYRPNVAEVAGRLLKIPELIRELVWEVSRHPSRINPLDIIGLLSPLLPSGIFSSHELMRYLERLFTSQGFVNDFHELGKELHIVSCALDTGQRVVFSKYHNEDVPVSAAVAASSAIPMLFKPV